MPRPRHAPTPPITTFAILGILTFGELSGYDVKRNVDQSIGHFWRPAKSHIYAELRRLATLGYAAEREVEQERRPDKRLYQITPAGAAALRAWLAGPEVGPEPNVLLLKLFFGQDLPVEALIAKLAAYRERVQDELAVIEETERQHAAAWDEELFYPAFTMRYGLLTYRAEIAWLDDSLTRLRQRLDSDGGTDGNDIPGGTDGAVPSGADGNHRGAGPGQTVRLRDGRR